MNKIIIIIFLKVKKVILENSDASDDFTASYSYESLAI